MRRGSIEVLLAAALAVGLVGCGGGGGGGGGGLPFIAPPPSNDPAQSAVSLSVEIAGSVANPDESGNYASVPGRQVRIKSGEAVEWSGSSKGDVVKRVEIDTSATQWDSRFSNASANDAGSYTLVARTSDGRSKSVTIVVQPGDYRNGDYMVFAANGSRQKLSVDFDQATYEMTDDSGEKASGPMFPPLTTRSPWSIENTGITGTSVASFRTLSETIVGGFSFAKPLTTPASHAVFPFLASRSFVAAPAKLDGVYNRFRVDATPAGRDSFIGQIRISGAGTVMKQCVDAGVYRIDDCPPVSVVTNSIERDAVEGLWALKNPDGSSLGRFAMAQIEGENVYLTAGLSGSSRIFSIGFPEAPSYVDFDDSIGWSTDGTINFANAGSAQYGLVSFSWTATDTVFPPAATTVVPLATIGGPAPTGMRVGTATGTSNHYFVMRSAKLEAMVGARTNVATQGFLHLGVFR